MRSAARLGVLALALAAGSCATDGAGAEEVEACLRELVQRSERHDARGVAALYEEDGLLLPPGGAVVRGRAAIEAFSALPPDAEIGETGTETLRLEVEGDRAWHAGRFAYVATGPDGRRERTAGTFLMVWRRSGGAWRVAADAWAVEEPTTP